MVVCRCSHQLRYGPTDPLLDFIQHRPSYSITLWAFPRIHNSFGKLYPLLSQPCSAFELELFTPEVSGLRSKESPMGWTYAFSNMCEPKNYYGSYSTVVISDKISTQHHWRRGVNERLCIREVGVDLELCVHAHGHDVDPIMEASCNSFLDILSFWYRWIDLLQSWFRPCSPLNTISRASLSTCLL